MSRGLVLRRGLWGAVALSAVGGASVLAHRAWADPSHRSSALEQGVVPASLIALAPAASSMPSAPASEAPPLALAPAPEPPSKRAPLVEAPKPSGKGLRVRVVDPDEGAAIPARVQVFPLGTRGAPSRAARAMRTLDSDGGEAVIDLPPGRYTAVATRGLEYSADRREVVVPAGGGAALFRLRRVAPSPGWVSCDLHVHSHGSWDSTIATADRLRSLASSGLDFAAPSQHNRVGSYGEGAPVGWAPSIEITTRFGHFNALPYVEGDSPWKRLRSAGELLAEVRAKNPESLVQINHPRYQRGMGYFNLVRWASGSPPPELPGAVDALEVYNGFEIFQRAKTEAVLRDWLAIVEAGRAVWATAGSDVHGVAGRLPGFPRLYVALSGDDDSIGKQPDAAEVVRQIRGGRAYATSGPLLEVSQGGRGPGEEARVEGGAAKIRVRVRAAPWVDVRVIEVWAGGRPVLSRQVEALALSSAEPDGTLEAARARALRFDDELTVPVGASDRALVVVVKGEAVVGEALPTMPYQPMAFSNPMKLATGG